MQHFLSFVALLAVLVLAVGFALYRVWSIPTRAHPGELGVFHLGAFFQSVDPASAFIAINAVPDQVLTVNGVDLRVPKSASMLVGEACAINDASLVRAQLQSPSLRAFLNRDIEPVTQGKQVAANSRYIYHGDSPIALAPDESLNLFVQSDPAAPAIHYGLVWLADGALKPVSGPVFSVRWTAAAVLVAGTWVNAPIVFSQVLPAGSYQIVGMRARSANLTAARCVFVGGGYRPGVVASAAIGGADDDRQRYGEMGVFGQFDNTTPPTVDFLGDTDNAQVGVFDLVKVK
jgi:hypothetical protein